jgi:hypothetical protein
MLYRWLRLDKTQRGCLWHLYGWFCTLMTFGCCVGIVTRIAKMLQLVSLLMVDNSRARGESDWYYAESSKWQAAVAVTSALEFLLLSLAKLMALDRMLSFAVLPSVASETGAKIWLKLVKFVMAAVVIINVIGLAGNLAAAHYWALSAELSLSAYSDTVANNNISAQKLFLQSKIQVNMALNASTVQSFCEVAVLLLIISAFAVVGFLCLRRIASAMRSSALHPSASTVHTEGGHLRRQILVTTCFMFVTFLLRSVLSVMRALSGFFSDSDTSCPGNKLGQCNPVCYKMWTHMLRWLRGKGTRFIHCIFVTICQGTPEFESSILLISSPLALAVALWGMTSHNALKLMRQNEKRSAYHVGLVARAAQTL